MISIVVPVYNEREYLSKNIDYIMKNIGRNDFEIIIAEDGSNDGTFETAKKLCENNEKILLSHSEKRLGKGLAIKNASEIANGDHICFMDIDLSTDMSEIRELITHTKDYDIVIASRLIDRSKISRGFRRRVSSEAYNFLIRCFFSSKIRDHQCGLKIFRAEVAKELFQMSENVRWFFDSEILILAQRKGYKIKEFPVKWVESSKSKVKISSVSTQMLKDMIRFKLR